jgi:hypothetical protein
MDTRDKRFYRGVFKVLFPLIHNIPIGVFNLEIVPWE